MSDAQPPSGTFPPRGGVLTSFRHRPRLLIGAAIGVAAYFAVSFVPAWEMRPASRVLIGWNAGAWAFLALIAVMVMSRTGNARAQSAREDESQWMLLALGIIASGTSLGAIIWELGPVKSMQGWPKAAHLTLVTASVLSSWTFIQTMFALHYAGVYYGKSDGRTRGGLSFPEKKTPGWAEFFYQAFVIGCTFASSDVNVTSSRMRRIVVIQGVVGFFYNTIVLALAINIAAGFF